MRDLNIAYGNSCMAKKWSNKTISWEELGKRLEVTVRTPESAEEYARMKRGDKESAKDKGGFVGGILRGGRRRRDCVVSRSMLTMDMDMAKPEFIDTYELLSTYTTYIYTTHGHIPEAPRLRLIVPFTRDATPDEYQAIARYFAKEWGIDQFDECSYRTHQLMYWPTTPSNGEYLFRKIDGEWLDPDQFLSGKEWKDCSMLPTSSRESEVKVPNKKAEDPLEKKGVVGAFCRAYGISDVMEEFLGDVYEPSVVPGRYQYRESVSTAGVIVYDDKFAYSHHSTDPACGQLLNAFDLVRLHKFGDEDDKKSFSMMVDFALKQGRVKIELANEKRKELEEDFGDDWRTGLIRDKGGKLINNLTNLGLILQNDPVLQNIVFNQLADGMEIRGEVPWEHTKFWRDADDAQLIWYIDQNYGTFSQRNYDIAVAKVVDDRSYHPIKQYIEALPPWDGKERVNTLLIDYLGAEDSEYVRAVTRKTLCAAISRIYNPGIKFDTILVLNGDQGIGKSTLIAKLGMEWFSDSLSLSDMNDKTAAEKLQGYWIHEIGEMAGMRKADLEKVKAFISRQDDKYRASFGRRVTPHPRQCIFFATTNSETGYLRDITGNRRFWNVSVPGNGRKHPWELEQSDVDQIWAETLWLVKEGEKLYLDSTLEEEARAQQSAAMERDEREGIVRMYLEMLLPETWSEMDVYQRREFVRGDDTTMPEGRIRRKTVSNMEIWCECFGRNKEDLRPSDSYSIASLMSRIEGWERTKSLVMTGLYGKQRVYRRVENNE